MENLGVTFVFNLHQEGLILEGRENSVADSPAKLGQFIPKESPVTLSTFSNWRVNYSMGVGGGGGVFILLNPMVPAPASSFGSW